MYKLTDDYPAEQQRLKDNQDSVEEKLKQIDNKTVIGLDLNRMINGDVTYLQEVLIKSTLRHKKKFEQMAVDSANNQLYKFGEKLDAGYGVRG